MPLSPPLTPSKKLSIQQAIGSLLYCALAVDCTLLVALGDLAATQNQATEETMSKLIWLLNYVASNPDSSVTYVASDMCLHIHSDASYLLAPKARSRAGAHFFKLASTSKYGYGTATTQRTCTCSVQND